VATGIAPETLYRHRADDVMALVHEVRRQSKRESWTTTHELLAQLIEAIGVLRIEACLLAGVPKWKLPEPQHVRRPWENEEPRVIRPSEFARLTVAR
jgi:hypothetical protein